MSYGHHISVAVLVCVFVCVTDIGLPQAKKHAYDTHRACVSCLSQVLDSLELQSHGAEALTQAATYAQDLLMTDAKLQQHKDQTSAQHGGAAETQTPGTGDAMVSWYALCACTRTLLYPSPVL